MWWVVLLKREWVICLICRYILYTSEASEHGDAPSSECKHSEKVHCNQGVPPKNLGASPPVDLDFLPAACLLFSRILPSHLPVLSFLYSKTCLPSPAMHIFGIYVMSQPLVFEFEDCASHSSRAWGIRSQKHCLPLLPTPSFPVGPSSPTITIWSLGMLGNCIAFFFCSLTHSTVWSKGT